MGESHGTWMLLYTQGEPFCRVGEPFRAILPRVSEPFYHVAKNLALRSKTKWLSLVFVILYLICLPLRTIIRHSEELTHT